METLMAVLVALCFLAAPVLAVIFMVQWIRKKPKKKIGISALCCMAGVIVFSLISGSIRLAGMTPEERMAYELALEQQDAERQAEQVAEKAAREAAHLAEEQEKAEKAAATQTEKDRLAADAAQAEREAAQAAAEEERIAQENAERAEQERLAVTFDEIYWAYKENILRADEQYKNNRYRITATINGMENGGLLNITGGATLTMEIRVGNTIVFFYATFEKEQEEALKQVSVGDTITFDGECLSAGTWIDCEIVE